jgi:hypothetical protein
MTTDPDPTKDDGEPTLLDTADYIAKSLNGEINPDEWDAI